MMGGFSPPAETKAERKLLSWFKSLNEGDKQTLLKFAEFLCSTDTKLEAGQAESADQDESGVVPLPSPIERPAQESVIKAIKRLTKTYPMIDKSTLVDKISGLMTEHLLRGREAESIINELEIMFKSSYESLL